MHNRNFRKIISLILAAVLCFCQMTVVFAEDTAEPWDGLVETAYFEGSVASSTITAEEGYYATIEDTDFLSSSYIKLTYTLSGDFTEETNVFTLKTYNTEWGGWTPTNITVGDSTLTDGVYSAYLSTADVLATLTEGTLRGINFYFSIDSAYETILTGIYYLAEEETEMTARDWLGYT
ncbi:MAG: hypothetical protein LIO44_05315, partial [Eubacterium sp.]|nr:hypothetical protein [Eubacterium sp.]